MNGKEFIKAVDGIVKEKGIDREIVFESMELALATAYKKNFNSLTNSKILIDRETGDIKVYSYKTVVPDEMATDEYLDNLDDNDENAEEFNPNYHITLTDARKINKALNIGDTIDIMSATNDVGVTQYSSSIKCEYKSDDDTSSSATASSSSSTTSNSTNSTSNSTNSSSNSSSSSANKTN